MRPLPSRGSIESGTDRIFVRTKAGRLACIALKDGSTRWELDALDITSVEGEHDVLLQANGSVAAIDTAGKTIWSKTLSAPGTGLAAIGDGVAVQTGAQHLILLDGADGSVRERRAFPAAITDLEIQDRSLLVSLKDGSVYTLGSAIASEGPTDLEGYYHMADILERRKKDEEAIGLYQLILNEVAPDNARAMHSLARLYRKTGQPELAAEWQARARGGNN
jgi:hypothetical protein